MNEEPPAIDADDPLVHAPRRPARASYGGLVLIVVGFASFGCCLLGPMVLMIAESELAAARRRGEARDGALVAAKVLGIISTSALVGGFLLFALSSLWSMTRHWF